MGQLNELLIKAAAPRDKEYLLADGEGLYLRVRPTGKVWVYRYKLHGKEAKLSIGHYPVVTLASARKKARAEAEKRADGVDPREARRVPDETTILRFRHLLEKHQLAPQVLAAINTGLAQQGLMLKTGTIVDATIIAAPSSTKNKDGERDPEMHQTKKGNQWHFGMKAHIGVDADSGLVHTVIGTAANVNDVTQAAGLLNVWLRFGQPTTEIVLDRWRRVAMFTPGSIAIETGLEYRPVADGGRAAGIYRRSVQLFSGRFALLDDGVAFRLVPWALVLEQRLGQKLAATVRGAGISWEFGRSRGPSDF